MSRLLLLLRPGKERGSTVIMDSRRVLPQELQKRWDPIATHISNSDFGRHRILKKGWRCNTGRCFDAAEDGCDVGGLAVIRMQVALPRHPGQVARHRVRARPLPARCKGPDHGDGLDGRGLQWKGAAFVFEEHGGLRLRNQQIHKTWLNIFTRDSRRVLVGSKTQHIPKFKKSAPF